MAHSEFREIDSWTEPVQWSGGTGEVCITLWGEMAEGPLPWDAPYDRDSLAPSHIIGFLRWDEETDDVGNPREDHFRFYRDRHGNFGNLFRGGKPSWDDILLDVGGLLGSELGNRELFRIEE